MKKQVKWSRRFITLLICPFSVLGIHDQKAINMKGTVYDSNNGPLMDANVSLKGNLSNGTIINMGRQFNFNVSRLNSTLIVTFIKYHTQVKQILME